MEEVSKISEKELKRYLELKRIEEATKTSLYEIVWELEISKWDKIFYIELIKYKSSWRTIPSLKTVKFNHLS